MSYRSGREAHRPAGFGLAVTSQCRILGSAVTSSARLPNAKGNFRDDTKTISITCIRYRIEPNAHQNDNDRREKRLVPMGERM